MMELMMAEGKGVTCGRDIGEETNAKHFLLCGLRHEGDYFPR
jgi:hypothetical protein